MAITEPPPNWKRRVLWFAGLYLAGAGVTMLAAYALRGLLFLGR
jgi:hypothetical protein